MHDTTVVRVPDTIGDRGEQGQSLPKTQPRIVGMREDRPSLDQLHREKRAPRKPHRRNPRLEDLGNPGMLQSTLDLRFRAQPRGKLSPGPHAVDNLQGDPPPRLLLLGLVDDPHAALPDPTQDSVSADR